jgi:HK97 family phage prohead protease
LKTPTAILKHAWNRPDHWTGLATAAHFAAGEIATSGASGVDARKEVDRLSQVLVHTPDGLNVTGGRIKEETGWKKWGKKDASYEDYPDVKTCMEFRCIVTTDRPDRDGDILLPGGARIDLKMPLLWQHNPMSPLGRLLQVVEQNEKKIVCDFGILDTKEGRDAARMVKYGMLRISHGFRPEDWEPRSKSEGDGVMGFKVKRYEMVEVSLVSIPSNRDAEITAHESKNFGSTLFRNYVTRTKSVTPVFVVGGWDKQESDVNTKGITLTKGRCDSLKETLELITATLAEKNLTASAKAMLKSAQANLDTIVKDADAGNETETGTKGKKKEDDEDDEEEEEKKGKKRRKKEEDEEDEEEEEKGKKKKKKKEDDEEEEEKSFDVPSLLKHASPDDLIAAAMSTVIGKGSDLDPTLVDGLKTAMENAKE